MNKLKGFLTVTVMLVSSVLFSKPNCKLKELGMPKTTESKMTNRSPFPIEPTKELFVSSALHETQNNSLDIQRLIKKAEKDLFEDSLLKSKDEKKINKHFQKRETPKLLTEAELEKATATLNALKDLNAELEKTIENLTAKDIKDLQKFADNKIGKNQYWKNIYDDSVSLATLGTLDPQRTYSLVLGNGIEKPSKEMEEETEKLTEGLIKNGYTVIYDADSNLGKVIGRAAKKQGIGITGASAKAHSGGQVFRISNDFSRMETLGQAASNVIASPDSLMGNALFSWGRSRKVTVLDPEAQWANPYRNWYKTNRKIVGPVGVHYDHVFQVSGAKSILGDNSFSKVKEQKALMPSKLKDFTYSELLKFLQTADTLEVGTNLMNGPGGAVYFGSGGSTPFDKEMAEIAKALSEMNIPAVTGGAGGSMKIVNREAYKVGVPSIGIPITGRQALSTEAVTFNEVHSMTIPTGGYETRIPLLLYNRPLVVMNPGGGGTMQEFATVLSGLTANPQLNQKILFVSSAYYKPLIDELFKSKQIPKELKNRIAIVDTALEAKKVVQEWIDKKEIDPKKLQSTDPLVPRELKPSTSIFNDF